MSSLRRFPTFARFQACCLVSLLLACTNTAQHVAALQVGTSGCGGYFSALFEKLKPCNLCAGWGCDNGGDDSSKNKGATSKYLWLVRIVDRSTVVVCLE